VDGAEKVISPNLKGVTAVLIFKMAGNTQTTEWHQNNIYGELDPYNAISCLTAMDDSTVENGCTWLLPGSHQQGQIQFSYTD
jgi:ectoine hydroxylase-related dioxygenase (phytanoyl-CoA dioxygenase family)